MCRPVLRSAHLRLPVAGTGLTRVARRPFTFQAGDRALVQPVKGDGSYTRLTAALRNGKVTGMTRGQIAHDDIIGKRARDTIWVKDNEYRLLKPTLEDYVVGSNRIVTPIYPNEANLIVSQLDIHATPPGSTQSPEEPLEIFEAGTGHGGLTLHLARAVHAANSSVPSIDTQSLQAAPQNKDAEQATDIKAEYHPAPFSEKWRSQRGAIIHTLDISSENSTLARKIVREFNRGVYAGNVDFYVNTIPRWLEEQRQSRQLNDGVASEFLSHAILDLPGSDKYIADVADSLRTDGRLVVFSPSVTQIAACVETIRRSRLPLFMEKVLEVGTGITGGRYWDVRAFRPRALAKAERDLAAGNAETDIQTGSRDGVTGDSGYEMVCRPTPGRLIAGGGFLGIWRKMVHKDPTQQP